MDEEIKERLRSRDLWLRALYMVFFAIVSVIVRTVVTLLAFVQFIAILLTGHANEPLLQLGNNLSVYAYQIIRFVTFNTEMQPFPFSAWPDEEIDDNPWMDGVSAAPEVAAAPTLEPSAEQEPSAAKDSDDKSDEGSDPAR
jgi:hypothetical protein